MASSDTDPVARLRDLFAGTAKPRARSQAKSKSNTQPRPYTFRPNRRPNRHLSGIALRAAARKTAGKELSPFEEDLLSMLNVCGGDDVIAGFGKEFTNHKRSRAVGESVFPDSVMQLHDDEAYTREHLYRDIEKIAPEIVAQPENQVIDIESILNGTVDSKAYKAVLAQTGQGVTVITSGPPIRQVNPHAKSDSSTSAVAKETNGASANQQASNDTKWVAPETDLRLAFDRMHCVDTQEGEWNEDEIYLCWGAASDGAERSYVKSKEYGDVVKGKTTYFKGEPDLYKGKLRLTFNAHIEVWESDHSTDAEYDELIKTLHRVSDELAKAAHEGLQSPESRKGAAYAALAALILEAVAMLLELLRNKDDCLCRRTITIDRAGINALANSPNKEMKLVFPASLDIDDDSTGEHEVYIKCMTSPPPCGGVMATAIEMSGQTLTLQERQPLSVNSNYGIGLACFKDQLVGIYGRGYQGYSMCMTAPISANPKFSTPDTFHDWIITSRPALAVIGSRLHVCLRAQDNDVKWLWTEDLKKWSPLVKLDKKPGLYNPDRDVFVGSVSMVAFKGRLYLTIVNFDDGTVLQNPEREDKYEDNPEDDEQQGYKNGDHRKIMLLEQDPNSTEAASWVAFSEMAGILQFRVWHSDFTPGLVVFGDKLYAIRVTDDNTFLTIQYDPTTRKLTPMGADFGNDVFSSPSCTATASTIIISYRNKQGTPMVGSISGNTLGTATPDWSSRTMAPTEAVADPTVCALAGLQNSVLAGWSAAYDD